MARRRFVATLEVEIEIEDSLLEAVLTDAWRAYFYVLHTPEDVADHLAPNLAQGRELTSLDGFADQPEGAASLVAVRMTSGASLVDDESSPSSRRRPTPCAPGQSQVRVLGQGRKGRRP